MIMAFIADDPRWDHQVDSRGDYYGQIMLTVGMDASPLEKQLQEHDDVDISTWDAWLAIDILGGLARGGSDEAIGILRRYLVRGYHVEQALEELASTRNPEAWMELDVVLSERFKNPEDLTLELGLGYRALDKGPWKEWRSSETMLGETIRSVSRRAKQGLAQDTASLTTEELLDEAERSHESSWMGGPLSERNSESDVAVLLDAIDIARPWRAVAALDALGVQRDPRVFGPAKRIIEQHRFSWTRKKRDPLRLRMSASHALESLSSEIVLPLAREWRSSRVAKFRHVALRILDQHATEEDLPWLREQLARPVTDYRVGPFYTYAEIITRIPDAGTFPALRRIFREFPYSYGRRFIARAMAATDTDFPARLAYDCLWDCEETVRYVGIQSVELSLPGARERIEALAGDQCEDEEIRTAARARLAGKA